MRTARTARAAAGSCCVSGVVVLSSPAFQLRISPRPSGSTGTTSPRWAASATRSLPLPRSCYRRSWQLMRCAFGAEFRLSRRPRLAGTPRSARGCFGFSASRRGRTCPFRLSGACLFAAHGSFQAQFSCRRTGHSLSCRCHGSGRLSSHRWRRRSRRATLHCRAILHTTALFAMGSVPRRALLWSFTPISYPICSRTFSGPCKRRRQPPVAKPRRSPPPGRAKPRPQPRTVFVRPSLP